MAETTLRDRFIDTVLIGIDFIKEEFKVKRVKGANIYP